MMPNDIFFITQELCDRASQHYFETFGQHCNIQRIDGGVSILPEEIADDVAQFFIDFIRGYFRD